MRIAKHSGQLALSANLTNTRDLYRCLYVPAIRITIHHY